MFTTGKMIEVFKFVVYANDAALYHVLWDTLFGKTAGDSEAFANLVMTISDLLDECRNEIENQGKDLDGADSEADSPAQVKFREHLSKMYNHRVKETKKISFRSGTSRAFDAKHTLEALTALNNGHRENHSCVADANHTLQVLKLLKVAENEENEDSAE